MYIKRRRKNKWEGNLLKKNFFLRLEKELAGKVFKAFYCMAGIFEV